MTALPSPVQSPYDRLYERLCIVSTNGFASSLRAVLHRLYDWLYNGSASFLQPALRRLYNRPYIAHTIVCTDVSIISAIVYNGSTNGSVNGSTIAHTIVCTNGSTNNYNGSTAAPRQLYGGSTAVLQRLYSGSTAALQRLYERLCNGSATVLRTAL
jgi:hypothetical protein